MFYYEEDGSSENLVNYNYEIFCFFAISRKDKYFNQGLIAVKRRGQEDER